MTTTVASVFTAAQELLDVAEAALQTTDAGFTGSAFLNPGQPAFDVQCDFVCVWQSATNLAVPATIPASQIFRTGPRVNLVTFNVTNGRCIHSGSLKSGPTIAEKTGDAETHMQDGIALWNGITDALADGELFQGVCSQLIVLGMTAYTPQGGIAGWNLVLQGQIDGYPVGT